MRTFAKKAESAGMSNAEITKYFMELDSSITAVPVADLPIKVCFAYRPVVSELAGASCWAGPSLPERTVSPSGF